MESTPLFGGNIAPACTYCTKSTESGLGAVLCAAVTPPVPAPGPCALYQYDPLKRVPRRMPSLPQFHPDDFKL